MFSTEKVTIEQIVGIDPGSLSTRQEWLRNVIVPSFNLFRQAADESFSELERIVKFVRSGDKASAARQWTGILDRYKCCFESVNTLIKFVENSRFDDLHSFMHKLKQHFDVKANSKIRSGINYLSGLGPAWNEELVQSEYDFSDKTTEILEAELLHTQLKWEILTNKFLSLQIGAE